MKESRKKKPKHRTVERLTFIDPSSLPFPLANLTVKVVLPFIDHFSLSLPLANLNLFWQIEPTTCNN